MIECPACDGRGVFDLSEDGTNPHQCLLCKGVKQVDPAFSYEEIDVNRSVAIVEHEAKFTCLHRGYFRQGTLISFIRKACFTIDLGFISVYGHVTGSTLDTGNGDRDSEFDYYARLYGEDFDHNRYNVVREDARKILEETAKELWKENYESRQI